MVALAQAGIKALKLYYIFALIIDLFASYQLATDHRFKRWKRYILAILIVPIPFVEWIYLGHLAYIKKGYLQKKLESILN